MMHYFCCSAVSSTMSFDFVIPIPHRGDNNGSRQQTQQRSEEEAQSRHQPAIKKARQEENEKENSENEEATVNDSELLWRKDGVCNKEKSGTASASVRSRRPIYISFYMLGIVDCIVRPCALASMTSDDKQYGVYIYTYRQPFFISHSMELHYCSSST
jgi:hypothetical protein